MGATTPCTAVTGASGFIGASVVRDLRVHGHRVVGIGRRELPGIDVVDDLSDPERLAGVLAEHGVEAIVHAAWSGHPRSSGHDYLHQFDSNLRTSTSVAVAAGRLGVRQLVFLSSGGGATRADHAGDPPPAYGWAKACAEALLAASAGSFGFGLTILRPTAVYGPGQDPSKKLGAVSVFAARLLAGEPLEVLGSLESGRDFLHVHDLASLIGICLRREVTGTFEVGGPELVSLGTLIDELTTASGRLPTIVVLPRPGVDPVTVQLDNGPISRASGWVPTTLVAEALPAILADLAREGDGRDRVTSAPPR